MQGAKCNFEEYNQDKEIIDQPYKKEGTNALDSTFTIILKVYYKTYMSIE